MKSKNSYPGGKSQAGTYQKIINQIPPHKCYISPFAGHDGIFRMIRPAGNAILLDTDPAVIQWWKDEFGIHATLENAMLYLSKMTIPGRVDQDTFIYLDPPYLKVDVDGTPVRKTQDNIYRHEFATVEEHTQLLKLIKKTPCKIAISGYWSSLYMSILDDWRSISFDVVTRSGDMATEYLWMNYPEPNELHDYRYLGNNFREREKITRQKRRWIARLERMDRLQRLALMDALEVLRT